MTKVNINNLGFISLPTVPRTCKTGDELYYILNIDASLTITNKKVCFLCGSRDVVSEYNGKAICSRCSKELKNLSVLSQSVTVVCKKLRGHKYINFPKEFSAQINYNKPEFKVSTEDNNTILLVPMKNSCHICGNILCDLEDALLHGYPVCDNCIDQLTSD